MSHSWKASEPRAVRATWPVMATMGTESALAPIRAGYQVGSPGPGGGNTHTNLAGNPGVTVGGVGGGLLVAHQYVPQLGIAPKSIVERQNSPAGVPEKDVNSFPDQTFADDFPNL